MVKRIKIGFGLICLLLAFLVTLGACGEEKQIGNYIYVPESKTESTGGRIHLSARGIGYDRETGEEKTESLIGLEFGIYVISAEGQLRPWANPLYPAEPMRVRTNEEGASFSLPGMMEFYLVQETGKEGYVFDRQAIPITGTEIEVINRMPAMLEVQVTDTLAEPIEGVEISFLSADGERHAVSDERGYATFLFEEEETGTLEESTVPNHLAVLKQVLQDGEETESPVKIHAVMGQKTSVTFRHAANGSVQLSMRLFSIGDKGEAEQLPLSGVHMTIFSDPVLGLVTDQNGFAEGTLLEGTYAVHFETEDPAVLLPVSDAELMVASGNTTTINLEATENAGRIELNADFAGQVPEGTLTIVSESSGEQMDAIALSAAAIPISKPLVPGFYWASLAVSGSSRIDSMDSPSMEELEGAAILVSVEAGQKTEITARITAPVSQQLHFVRQSLDDLGSVSIENLAYTGEAELINSSGERLSLTVDNGVCETLTFPEEYIVRISDEAADTLGIKSISDPFLFPTEDESVSFPSKQGRLLLSAVDSDGHPAAAGIYQIVDAEGQTYDIEMDESGTAVSPALSEGEVRLTNLVAPVNCMESPEMRCQVEAGALTAIEIPHELYGHVLFTVRKQRVLDGQLRFEPIQGATLSITALEDSGREPLAATTNSDGQTAVYLPEGNYLAVLADTDLTAALSVQNAAETPCTLDVPDQYGAVNIIFNEKSLEAVSLSQVVFALEDEDGGEYVLDLTDHGYYAEHLPAGTYTVSEIRMPAGYTPMKPRTITVTGGQMSELSVPLQDYAVLYVSKYGLTFDDSLRNYLVPLSGSYGVYTKTEKGYLPYPSETEQDVIWANTAEDETRHSSVQLPAEDTGTEYYLHEMEANIGFADDEEWHAITLFPGKTETVSLAVTSDRGFYRLSVQDAESGAAVSGTTFAILDAAGVTVETFTVDGVHQNAMALPVGLYSVKELNAAPGYMLNEQETSFEIYPYLSQGGQMTELVRIASQVPTKDLNGRNVLLTADENESSITAQMDVLPGEYPILRPAYEVSISSEQNTARITGIRLDDLSVSQKVNARLEVHARNGGWLEGEASVIRAEELPKSISPPAYDIDRIRLSFLDPETGLEQAASLMPWQLTLLLGNNGTTEETLVSTTFSGSVHYRRAAESDIESADLSVGAKTRVSLSNGQEGVASVPEGKISGFVFYDSAADGWFTGETDRLNGVTVSLLRGTETVAETTTDAQGGFVFSPVAEGAYTLAFDSRNGIYTHGEEFSNYIISRVNSEGISEEIRIDREHRDVWLLAGAVRPAGIRGQILGAENLDEPLTLTLSDEHGNVQSIPAKGNAFEAERLLPGTYVLKMQIPEGMLCREGDGEVERSIVLGEGEQLVADAIELLEEAMVAGQVWLDENGDGIRDSAQKGVSQVKVELSLVSEDQVKPVAETTTDENGEYQFRGVFPGEYLLTFELDGNTVFTRYGEASQVYGSASSSGSTKPFTVLAGEELQGIDVGTTVPARLEVVVFKDSRADGLKQMNESGLEGVRIAIARVENGELLDEISAYTDADGKALFSRVSPGEYVLQYRMPGNYRTSIVGVGTPEEPANQMPMSIEAEGKSEPFQLRMGSSNLYYIGAVETGNIFGTVFYDDNADTQRGETDAPIPGMQVELYDADNARIAETTTDAAGSYAFTGIPRGRYSVRFYAEAGQRFAGNSRSVARNMAERSDTNISSTHILSVEPGKDLREVNAAIVRPAMVRGRIFEDRNGNQVEDAEENPLSGVTVNLTSNTGRTIESTVRTDDEGFFTFTSIYPGTYRIRMDAPEGYVYAGEIAGNVLPVESNSGSWYYTAPFTVLGNSYTDAPIYGLLMQSVIRGSLWEDLNYNGTEDSGEPKLRSVLVTLLDSTHNEVSSVRSGRMGEFEFDRLMPGDYSLQVTLDRGYVFTIDGRESGMPRSNQQEMVLPLPSLGMGETMENVKIGALKPAQLSGYLWFDADDDGRRQIGDQPLMNVEITLRVASGTDVGETQTAVSNEEGQFRFSNVMPGDVELSLELPEQYGFARNAKGTRRVSIIPETVENKATSEKLTISSGDVLPDLDIGVVEIGSISGVVWSDEAYTGKYSGKENGIESAVVSLIDQATGKTVRSVRTEKDGRYLLDRIRTGDYAVQFTLPGGWLFTKAGDSLISDSDTQIETTKAFTLAMGETKAEQNVGGIFPATVSGAILDEDTENGFASVVVSLMDGGTVLKTVSTNKNGEYQIEGVRPGTYRLRFELPNSSMFAIGTPLQLSQNEQEGESDSFTTGTSQNIAVQTLYAVLASQLEGNTWLDANADGNKDAGEAPITNVALTLIRESDGVIIGTTLPDEYGHYVFTGLRRGVYILEAELPERLLFADQNGKADGSGIPPTENNIGESLSISIQSGETIPFNIGAIEQGSIGDTVWLDLNGNGLQDYKEPLISDVYISLLSISEDGDEEEISGSISDEYGYYHFRNLRPGQYRIRVESDVKLTQHLSELDEINSDPEPETYETAVFHLTSGEIKNNIDIGLAEEP